VLPVNRDRLKEMLDSLDRKATLNLLAYTDQRMAQLALVRDVLQQRLAQLMSTTTDQEPVGPLLTVPAMAKVLKLGRARTYELIRGGDLPGVRVGVRQVRVRRADLIKFMQPQNGRV
jgi:excisionase family DNA binding protein